jgi:rhodanese-related sulfurtransferase
MEQEEPFTIIDVRTPSEIDEYGRPVNSHLVPLNVPAEDGEAWIVNPEFETTIAELAGGKEKKILTICTLSMRAARAAHLLQEAGFTDVHVFRHGIQGRISGYEITKGWRAEGLPYEEAKDRQ